MKKLNPLLTIVAPLILLFAVSCSKKSDPAPPTRTALISAKNWKITDVQIQGASGTMTESPQAACNLDDYYAFAANGVYTYYPGNDLCKSGDITANYTWKFKTDDTVLETVNATGTYDYTITSLTSTVMTFTYLDNYDSDGNGTLDATITFYLTWTAI